MIETLEEKKAIIKNKGYEILSNLDKINYYTQVIIRNKEGYIGHLSYKSIKNGSEPLYFSPKNNKDFFIYNLNLFCFYNKFRVKVLGFADEQKWTDTGVKCKCECGNIFETNVYWLSYKTRCNKCAIKKSRWCLEVEKILKQNNISYKEEVKFNDCRDIFALPFDYQLDINNGLIEVDGEQHFSTHGFGRTREEKAQIYKRTVYHDNIKNEYCKKNNIPLLRISFKDVIDGSYKKKIEDFIHIK